MLTFTSLPTQKHQFILPLIVILLSLLAFIFNSEHLHFQRDVFINGEYWRGFTAHFLHTNLNHLLLNISAVVLLWALHGQFYNRINYLFVFIVCAVTTTFGITIFSPEITQYVGLSGILHGLFIWGTIKDIQHKDKTGYLLLAAILLKVLYEQLMGPSAEVAKLISATVAIDAHLWGMIGGGIIGIASYFSYKRAKLT